MVDILQPAFTGGLVDPELDVRTETALYGYSCQTLENFIVKPGGGIYRRPGMRHVFRQERPARLIPFQFNREQVYILIFVEFRFYAVLDDQVLVTGLPLLQPQSPLTPMGSTPYTEEQIFELDFAQSADKIFITHPDHDPAELVRIEVDEFKLNFSPSPFLPVEYNPVFSPTRSQADMEPTQGADTISYKYQIITEGGRSSTLVELIITDGFLQGNWPSGNFGQVVVVINHPIALVDDLPFRVIFYKERGGIFGFVGQSTVLNKPFSILEATLGSGGSASEWNLSVNGVNEFYLTGPSVSDLGLVKPTGIMRLGLLTVQDNLGNLDVDQWAFGDNDSLGFDTLYFRDPTGVAPVPASIQFAQILIDNNYDPDTTDPPIEINTDITGENNRPVAVTLHQQRLWFGGNNLAPQTLFASRINNFISFKRTEAGLAADSMELPIVSSRVNEILWMESFNNDLMVGTAGSEWRISAPDGAGLFAGNIVARHLSGWGSSPVSPVIIGDTILFVEAGGKDIRDFFQAVQPEGFTGAGGNYLTKLVRDLFENRKVVNMAYQRSPESILWVVLDNGDLIAVTYLKEARIIAWHIHPTDGKVQSVAVIPGNNGDRVYFSVQRECGHSTVRLDDRFDGNDITKAFFTDEFIIFDGSLVGSGFTWAKSVSGTNEYYVQPFGFGSPSLVYFGRVPKNEATIGTLAVGEWGFGNNDGLIGSTVYVRLDVEAWDEERIYKQGEIVKASDTNDYRSEIDDNINNDPVSASGWTIFNDEGNPENRIDDFVSIYATEFSGMNHLNCSLRDTRYNWEEISSGSPIHQLLQSAGPFTVFTLLPEFPFVYEDGKRMTKREGAVGGLLPGEYNFFEGNYFVHLTDSSAPNFKPSGFIAASNEDNGGANPKLTILADGAPIAEEVILDFEGTFTLSEPAFRVCAGLNYISKVSPLDLELPSDPRRVSTGSQGLTKSINSCRIKLRDTVGGKIGASEDRLNDLEFNTVQYDTAIQPFNGYARQQIRSGNSKAIRIIVIQDQPLPMTILALIPDINIKDSRL